MDNPCNYCPCYFSSTNECVWGGPGDCIHDESILDKFSDFESDDMVD